MRLRQIEVFHAVYSNGSISAAARALHVSQPSVSKVLRHTEVQLGLKLFQLSRGRLLPTDEAHALFREVDDAMRRIGSLRQTVRNLSGVGAGHLRLGVVPSLGLDVIPAAVAEFRQRHRGVTFSVQTLHHNDMLRALYERECDLAFGYDLLPHPRLAMRKLSSAEVRILAPKGTFDSRRRVLALADLNGHEMIGVSTSGPVGALASAALERAEVAVREVASVGTYYIAAALVRFGCGVAMVDEFTAESAGSADVDVYGISPALNYGVFAAWLEDRPLSSLGSRFVKCVERTIRAGAQPVPRA
jgi:DNA-binding transcriptional LysR family regulator